MGYRRKPVYRRVESDGEGEQEDGNWEVLPIPKELGDDGFLKVDERVTSWLVNAVRDG